MTTTEYPVRPANAGDPHLDHILGHVDASLREGLVPVEIFNDATVFKAEMDRIFARSWVFVAHESEIPKIGDFVQRRIGLDSVIVSRDEDGQINVMSNHCRHRGTQVCQSDCGNTTLFKCMYHGWAYKLNGELAGVPHLKEAYGTRPDPQEWGLLRAPKVASRHGFVFACLSPDAPSLDEYLGGGGWMFDAVFGLHAKGMRVVGAPDRYKVRADWKSGAENFAGDVYHLDTLHWGIEKLNLVQGLQRSGEIAHVFEMENGHNFVGFDWEQVAFPGYILWGYPPEIHSQFDLSGLDDVQLHTIKHWHPTVGTIFPNLSFIRFNYAATPDSPPVVSTRVSQWQPTGPGEMELWSWQLAWDFMSEEDVQSSFECGQYIFGSSGIFEQDDSVAWEGAALAGASSWSRRAGSCFHYQYEGAADTAPDPDWKGPGIHRASGWGEHNQLAFYRHWLEVMREPSAPGAAVLDEERRS